MNQNYNPDVFSCLASLSNDEVFTLPQVVNDMLDLLPQELFRSKETTFLDPVSKSGVFLREIAKRLLVGLVEEIPDLQQRIDHIFHQQLYGIALTELTSMLSRRSVYCSKYPNSIYSVSKFDTESGNMRFERTDHAWFDGRCSFCGASQQEYARGEDLETHAYEFIHTTNPERIFDVNFDVIIGNPPYQLSDGGNGASASPIYQKFVEQAIKLNPRYLTMITPSRYLAGGKGLDKFRKTMLSEHRITKIFDFINAKDCFPENSISGGVNYFLWERDANGLCEFTSILGDRRNTMVRKLNEFPVFVRYNQAISVIHKVTEMNQLTLSTIVSSRNPYGLPTSVRGEDQIGPETDLVVFSSKGSGYIASDAIGSVSHAVDSYRILLSRITYEHAGEPDKDGQLRVLSRLQVLKPNEVCTDSYIVIGEFLDIEEATNLLNYLKCKFTRFLISQTLVNCKMKLNT